LHRRKYYERCNSLIQRYVHIDRLLDSSLPHDLIQEYTEPGRATYGDVVPTIYEQEQSAPAPLILGDAADDDPVEIAKPKGKGKLERRPRILYKLPDEDTPLLHAGEVSQLVMPMSEPDGEADSQARIVLIAIYVNLAANTILLILKIIVTALTSSVSVLASLVDGALDFLSTAIVWTTTRLIARQDRHSYPVGRRRLEPLGVLVFSVIMVTAFFQVALEGLNRLMSGDHKIVQLTVPAVVIMASTVLVKFLCWLWCRFIKNSSVQALAQDAMTDVVFNIFSILFPLSTSSPPFYVLNFFKKQRI
jgi:Cation efflux family